MRRGQTYLPLFSRTDYSEGNRLSLFDIFTRKTANGVHVPDRIQSKDTYRIEASSIANLFSDIYSPYKMAQVRDLGIYPETYFFDLYEESYVQNPWTHMLVEYVVKHTLGDGYHFEGPGADKVEKFFVQDDTRTKLEMQFRSAVKCGSGIMELVTKGKKGPLVQTRLLNPSKLEIELDDDEKSKTYGQRIYKQGQTILNSDNIFHLMVVPEYNRAWPMSLLRPNIVFLTALYDCGGDVFAAIKRAAYSPIIARLDLDNYPTEEEKKKALREFSLKLKDLQSATTNFTLDKRHSLELLSKGGAGARMMPVNDMIEPWLTVALMNFNMPLGLVLQGGANKAILDGQREDNRIAFSAYRRYFAEQVENKLIPRITGRDCKLVWNKAPPTSPETQAELNSWAKLYQLGVVSKEFILDQMDIEDTGTTFYPNPSPGPGQPPGTDNSNRAKPDPNNTDPEKNQMARNKRDGGHG